jgi:hypothetical protein
MAEFLKKDYARIEEHLRLIKERDLFEKGSKFDLC